MRSTQRGRASASRCGPLCGDRKLRSRRDYFARRDIHVSEPSCGYVRDVLRRCDERGLKSGDKVWGVGSDVRRRSDWILQTRGSSALLCAGRNLRRSYDGVLQLRRNASDLGSGRHGGFRNRQSRLLRGIRPGDDVGQRHIRFQLDLGRSDDGLLAIVGFAWNRNDRLRREFGIGLARTLG